MWSSYGDVLDICVVDRAVEEVAPVTSFVIPIPDNLLHNYTVITLWMLIVLFVSSSPKKGASLFLVSFVSLWFHLTYWLLLLLKGLLDDTTCSFGRFLGQPNSISGHYCYFTYCFLSLTTIFRVKHTYWKARNTTRSWRSTLTQVADNHLSKLLFYTFIIGGVVTVYRTFFHGYHSLRQILYGISLGCFSHALMETVLWEYFIRERHTFLILGILFVLSPNLLFFCTLFWPFPVYGYPVGSKQVLGHVVNWLILFVFQSAWVESLHAARRGTRDKRRVIVGEVYDVLKINNKTGWDVD